ncbi:MULTISPECIES: hypothetical protein [unclassified Acidovorax]|uniref:hypothetical protein n=1 Tax=unclassified Acidovorax TaxID=2684926 RepID=UPI002883348C|nr:MULTISPECIES: hypothetical protein [unclassified Acidovorax]
MTLPRMACLAAFFLMTLVGCSPALNWRSVPLEDVGLTALLPCKPDHTVRSVDVGGRKVDLALWGCDADGATFAVSHMRAPGAAQADAALEQWRAAVLARLQVAPPGGATPLSPFLPAGSMALPSSGRLVAQGQRADGTSVSADAVWFAKLDGSDVRLYHAVVYAPSARPQAADTFFAGLVLQ